MENNKKLFFLIFSLIVLAKPAMSQDKSPNPRPTLYRELSFNVNSIFQHVPVLPTAEADINTYDILYRFRKWNNRSTSRWGLTGTFIAGSSSANGFIIKYGKEWHYILLDKWTYYVGFDVLLFAQANNNMGGLGTGPIGGLRFKINDRIFLSTESSVYLTVAGGNDLNFGLGARPPSALAINIRFF